MRWRSEGEGGGVTVKSIPDYQFSAASIEQEH
jgi:hypothetical protein